MVKEKKKSKEERKSRVAGILFSLFGGVSEHGD